MPRCSPASPPSRARRRSSHLRARSMASPPPPRPAGEPAQPSPQAVVPRARELDDLLLELAERNIGDLAEAHVHREVNLRELALAEREGVLDARALEPQ